MEIFKSDKIYDFMGKSKLFIALSLILVLASYVMLFTRGLHYGIDFAGGTLVQLKYEKSAPIKKLEKI